MDRAMHDATHRVLVVLMRPRGSPKQLTGGGEVSTIQIALHLRRLGAEVYTIERPPSVIDDHGSGLKVHLLADRRGLLGDVISVVRMVRQAKCDSVYVFTDYVQDSIVPGFLAALITRKKLFVNVLGAPGTSGRRTEDSLTFVGLIRDRVRRKPGFRSLISYATFQASRRLGCRMGTCLVATHYVASYVRSLLRSRRTFVVGRGVEELWFSDSGAVKEYDGVYSGRFDRSKRVSTLVKAWQIVVARKPDARLLLIGNSGEEYSLMERFAIDSGLSPNLTFAGFVGDRATLVEKIQSARLFIFPSVKEGFGLVVAEAMAAGLPCVLSDIPPLREVYGGSAVFVRADDPSAFADGILGLLSDQKKLEDYAKRSESLAKTFSWDSVATKVLGAMTTP